ncbi:MAG: 50S ribosomal protein L11 methyltransferase [Deltaproteobacteria bacterium]|nr:50S ribosomal protein L11 methyltransferase [Deltaproteobacteria bacterium]
MSDAARFAQIVVECSEEQADAINGQLLLLGADGTELRDASTLVKGGELGATVLASFGDESLAQQALEAMGANATLVWIEGDEWADAWKAHWQPMRLGERIMIVPSWLEYTAEPTDVVIELDPGRAFGTGQHASTALAVAALERHLSTQPEALVLDVGCGSGILAFCALRLGAERAIGCDIDGESIEVASENADKLSLSSRITLRVGGLDVIAERSTLVLANIEAVVLVPMAEELSKRVLSGGRLVLSGILAVQREQVVEAYQAQGLSLSRCEGLGEWIAPEFVRP